MTPDIDREMAALREMSTGLPKRQLKLAWTVELNVAPHNRRYRRNSWPNEP
ncbi:MAG: hypothetical protein SGJ19_29170 [Planctomycetia bacterium]|nr:hypothetical protein [Planctomycetia bacterium]